VVSQKSGLCRKAAEEACEARFFAVEKRIRHARWRFCLRKSHRNHSSHKKSDFGGPKTCSRVRMATTAAELHAGRERRRTLSDNTRNPASTERRRALHAYTAGNIDELNLVQVCALV
jgi:hypothetical protein